MDEQLRTALDTFRKAAAEMMAAAASEGDEKGMDDAQVARTALSNLERVFGD